MAGKKVQSSNPQIQQAIEARRAREAARKKAKESPKKKAGSKKVETKKPGNIFQKRANMINGAVKKATGGK